VLAPNPKAPVTDNIVEDEVEDESDILENNKV
jgi:hypothetical protein